jgi:hypothetical protein
MTATLLGSLLLESCTTWHVEAIPAAEVVARDHPAVLRVRSGGEGWEKLYRPEVRGDSLIGGNTLHAKHRDRAVSLPDVTAVETHHFSAGKTLGLGMAVVGALGIAALIAAATIDGPFDTCCQ